MEIVEYAFKRGAATRITERLITMLKSDWAHKQTWKMFKLVPYYFIRPTISIFILSTSALNCRGRKNYAA